MNDSFDQESAPSADRPVTTPRHWQASVRAFEDEQRATKFGLLVMAYINELSRDINLGGLDSITIASNYPQALLDLDRGYVTSYELKATCDIAEGVAMSPAVIRDGAVKTHIVFNAAYLLPIEDQQHKDFLQAVHLLAHECAHVEVTNVFNKAFPGTLLKPLVGDLHDSLRWQVISSCWDEYAATWISALYGRDPTTDYEMTFLQVLSEAEDKANAAIVAYRLHGDHSQIALDVYAAYGNLMKYACYQLGNLAGRGLSICDLPKTKAALQDHWFAPYLARLADNCRAIAESYGKWDDKSAFEKIGDVADDLIAERGLTLRRLADGQLFVDVPFTFETMPVQCFHLRIE